jgi:hypothetical protein
MELSGKEYSHDELFWRNLTQIWSLRETNMLIKTRNWNCSFNIKEKAGESELRLIDTDHINDSLKSNQLLRPFNISRTNI